MGITVDKEVVEVSIQAFDRACQTRLCNRFGLARLFETGGADQAAEASGKHGGAAREHDQADGDNERKDKTIFIPFAFCEFIVLTLSHFFLINEMGLVLVLSIYALA